MDYKKKVISTSINKFYNLELYLDSDSDYSSDDEYKLDSKHNSEIDRLLKEDSEENLFRQEQFKSQLEFNESIIQERNEEIEEIYKEVLEINEIFKDLNKLVHEQSEPINELEKNIDSTVEKTQNGVEQLKKAEIYHNALMSKRNKLILMSLVGLSINIPVTLTLGLKAGAISGLSTVGLGAITSLFSNK